MGSASGAKQVLWSQERPRRRVTARFLLDEPEAPYNDGDLLISFVGFDRGAGSAGAARVFQVQRLWLPKFARHFGIPRTVPMEVLRERFGTHAAVEELHAWLWATGWVYTNDRPLPPVGMGGGQSTPNGSGSRKRLPALSWRRRVLHRELRRVLLAAGDEFRDMVYTGLSRACDEVEGGSGERRYTTVSHGKHQVKRLWAYPEIELEDDFESGEPFEYEPFPADYDDVLEFAGVHRVISITRGIIVEAYSFGDVDCWMAEGEISFGMQPATKTARTGMLQRLADALGGGGGAEYELEGVDEATEAAFRRWCDERWAE